MVSCYRVSGGNVRLADRCRLDRDMHAAVARQPLHHVDIEEFYLQRVPQTHGYPYCGAAWE